MNLNDLCFGCIKEKCGQEICPHCGYDNNTPPELPQYIKPGTILSGKFLVGRGLGHGGFGVTYLGFDLNLDIKVAIKEYLPQTLATRTQNESTLTVFSGERGKQFQDGIKKFLDEAKTVAKFNNHNNIVTVRDFFTENGTAYMVMDYIEGVDLKDYVQNLGRPLMFDEALGLLNPIMDALQTIHNAGLLHRDISPDNIFITKEGTPILLDFGAARQFLNQDAGLSVILKPGYAPEEQYRRNGNSGPWTDLYAFAATFYHVTTGKRPMDSLDRMEQDGLIPPSALGVNITSSGETALLKALSIKGADRYQSMADFLYAINMDNNAGKVVGATAPVASNVNWNSPQNKIPKSTNQPFKVDKNNVSSDKNRRSVLFKIGIVAASLVGVLLLVVIISLIANTNDSVETGTVVLDQVNNESSVQDNQSEQATKIEVVDQDNSNQNNDSGGQGSVEIEGGGANGGPSEAAAANDNTPVTFVDPAFESMIKLALNKQGNLTVADLSGIETLQIVGDKFVWINNDTTDSLDYFGEDGYTVNNLEYVSTGQIKRVDDIVNFPNLEKLEIIFNNVANLDGMKSAPQLISADFSYNKITDISPIYDAPKLKMLEVAGNEYTGIRDDAEMIDIYDTPFMLINPYRYLVNISAGAGHTLGVTTDGRVMSQGTKTSNKKTEVNTWESVYMVAAGADHSVALLNDGTCVATGSNKTHGQCNVQAWVDIEYVAVGDTHTVGVRSNGTCVAVGLNDEGQCDVEDWTDIIMVVAGAKHTVGLKKNGSVVATGHNGSGRCNVEDWYGIQFIAAGSKHTLGLMYDGTVVGTGWNDKNQLNKLSQWENVVCIAAGTNYSVGVTSDGGMVLSGTLSQRIPNQKNAEYVYGAANSAVVLYQDGSFDGFGDNTYGQNNVKQWQGMIFN